MENSYDYPHNLFTVRDKAAVITGGSGGLGRAMAIGLGAAGMRVSVLSRRIEECERVAAAVREINGNAIAVACDVSSLESLKAAREKVLAAYGEADVIVNCAGGSDPLAATDVSRSFFDLEFGAMQGGIDGAWSDQPMKAGASVQRWHSRRTCPASRSESRRRRATRFAPS